MSQLFSTDLLAQKGHGSIKVSDGFLGLREQRLQSERISNRFQYNRMKFFGKWQIKHIIRNQRYWVDSYKLGIQSTNPTYWRTKEDSGLGGNRHGSCIRYHWYHLHFSETQPQSSKASLAPHASKPQSCKASLAPHASKPQSLNAWMLWRFGAWRLFQALALLGAFPTPQSLNAWMLWPFGALALGGSCTLWRFLTLFRRLKASKPQSLNAWMLWRFGACPTPQSLKASKPGRLDALALLTLWRLALWRFGALALGALDALVPLGPLALCGSLTLWRFGAWRSWCFGASWPFGALRLFDALALLGALRLRGSVTLWHFAALLDMPSWNLEKKWFCRFYFFQAPIET